MSSVLLIALTLLLASCDHDHGHPHPHEPDSAHGHADDEERPTLSVTAWSDDLELFAELPALVVGEESAFAAHVTVLDGFRPAREGAVTAELRAADGVLVVGTVREVARPGIFRPALTPRVAGPCELRLVVEHGGRQESFAVPD